MNFLRGEGSVLGAGSEYLTPSDRAEYDLGFHHGSSKKPPDPRAKLLNRQSYFCGWVDGRRAANSESDGRFNTFRRAVGVQSS